VAQALAKETDYKEMKLVYLKLYNLFIALHKIVNGCDAVYAILAWPTA
jgi:hypothetical protein